MKYKGNGLVMKKIGFFGGSFNPVTYAHINLAKQIISECNLDKLFFIPIGDFYEKQKNYILLLIHLIFLPQNFL